MNVACRLGLVRWRRRVRAPPEWGFVRGRLRALKLCPRPIDKPGPEVGFGPGATLGAPDKAVEARPA